MSTRPGARPLPRRFRIANYFALVPFVAAMVWVIANGVDDPHWPQGLVYLALAAALASMALSFADEAWAQTGAKASQGLLSALMLLAYVDMVHDAAPPLWVPLAFYGSLAVIGAATLAGKVAGYREARLGDAS
ncbi:hypothetical protein [Demequina aestuarii]|uniref:hypothetical protein n=1 Tax=Demequina aestuarii TaxID=327095 RepID=UPI000783191C|nr:hypothetical protein [Demequina aestuarii]